MEGAKLAGTQGAKRGQLVRVCQRRNFNRRLLHPFNLDQTM